MVFLSQESSADIVQEGLRSGALGYVAKAQAGIELLAAVEAICQGSVLSVLDWCHVPFQLCNRATPNRLHPCLASQPGQGTNSPFRG